MPGHDGLGFRIFQHKLRSLSKAALLSPRSEPISTRFTERVILCVLNTTLAAERTYLRSANVG